MVGCTVLASGAVVGVVWFYGRSAEDIDLSPLEHYQPPQVTRIVARDGTVIGEVFDEERRTVVPYDEIPEHVRLAFLAAEDADFFRHAGMDYLSMARAAIVNLTSGSLRQGASTITQQTVKNVLLSQDRTVERKSQEIVLSMRVERTLSKAQILEIYLNEIYLGEGRYGVEEASRHYFGKSVRELDLGEAATLAGLPKAPSRLAPCKDSDGAKDRQRYVLGQMVEHGFASEKEVAPYLDAPLAIVDHQRHDLAESAPEVVDAVKAELRARYTDEELRTLGATVYTTVDLELQRAARSSVSRGLDELERRQGYGHHARKLGARGRKIVRGKAPARPVVGGIYRALVLEPTADGVLRLGLGDDVVLVADEAWDEARHPEGGAMDVMITSIEGEGDARHLEGSLPPGPEAALLIADNETGEVLALVGGRAQAPGQFDRALQARRQPGSTFKPIVYAAAMADGSLTAASTLPDQHERPLRLRAALARSDNAVAVALLERTGAARVHDMARDLGVESPLVEHPSLALGASELRPIELLGTYLAFARGGPGVEPTVIRRIELPDGTVEVPPRRRPPGLDPALAALVTSMLESVVDEGTGRRALALGRPVAGKTGTTNDSRDAWFAGFTGDHTAVVWVGFDQPRTLGHREGGSRVALPIWLEAMGAAEKRHPVREFEVPERLEHHLVDGWSGAPACRPADRWWVEGHCDEWFWGTCVPSGEVVRPAYLRCADPEAWVDELFLPETGPNPIDAPRRFREHVHLESVSVFDQGEDAESIPEDQREALARLARQVRTDVEAQLEKSWPWLQSDGASGSARFEVRLDGSGFVLSVRSIDPTADPELEQAGRWALLRSGPWSLPEAALDPDHGQAQLRLRVSSPEPDEADGD